MIKVAVVGNPNVGKTALINYLTNSNLKIGNWPGVTVEKKEAFLNYKGQDFYFVDLPGVYNLSPYSLEEKITRDYLLNERVDVILNVLDSKNLKKGLLLTSQILEFQIPTLVVFNMWDEVSRSFDVDLKTFEELLNVKAVKASSKEGFGKEQILENLIYLKENFILPKYISFSREIEDILKILPFKRFVNIKILEGDKDILEKYKNRISTETLDRVKNLRKSIENKYNKDISELIFSERYKWANAITYQISKGSLDNVYDLTDKIDDIILNPKLSPFILIAFIYIFFKLIFTVTEPFIGYIEHIQEFLTHILNSINIAKFSILKPFIESVFIEGIGLLLSFVPLIFVIYFIFALLEDSGIISRFALLSDRFLHKLGLHGNAIIPIILGYGCNVPAVASTRILNSFSEKVIVATSLPFTLCGARLPVIAFFALTFFPQKKTFLTAFLYILSLVLSLLSIYSLRKALKVETSNEIFIELPNYRFPKISYSIKYAFDKVLDFLKGATGIVFLALLILFFLLNFPPNTHINNSLAAKLSQLLLPIFKPLDISSWQVLLSLFPGFVAKETIVASLKEILSLTKVSLSEILTKKGALSFIIFASFYLPCVATLSALKKEVGTKFMFISMLISLIFAYISAFVFSNILEIII